jgi:hypothetical protein
MFCSIYIYFSIKNIQVRFSGLLGKQALFGVFGHGCYQLPILKLTGIGCTNGQANSLAVCFDFRGWNIHNRIYAKERSGGARTA